MFVGITGRGDNHHLPGLLIHRLDPLLKQVLARIDEEGRDGSIHGGYCCYDGNVDVGGERGLHLDGGGGRGNLRVLRSVASSKPTSSTL